MMGSYIIVAAGLPPESTGIDILLLVDWQKGHVTTVSKKLFVYEIFWLMLGLKLCSTQTRTYLTDFLVLSDDILALIRGPRNAIELCQIDTSSTTTAPLQTIRFLELPPLVPYARLNSASLITEGNLSTSTALSGQRSRRRPPRYPFSPSPTDALVLLTLTAKIAGSAFVDMRTYTLAVHVRTLLSYASPSPSPSSHVSRSSLPPAVPWGAWGIPATRCFEGPAGSSSSAVVMAGQRWFDLKGGAIRDFCPHRVRRAPARGTGNPLVGLRNSTLASGSVFACDIESALPYSEIALEKGDSYSSFVVEDAMIDMERVVFLTGVSDFQTSSLPPARNDLRSPL